MLFVSVVATDVTEGVIVMLEFRDWLPMLGRRVAVSEAFEDEFECVVGDEEGAGAVYADAFDE